MNICNTHIDTKEIMGIGQLMVLTSTDPVKSMYQERQEWFIVICKTRDVRIEDIKRYFDNVAPDVLKYHQKASEEFQAGYEKAKAAILKLIGDE
jgi:hypothetical protein